MVYLKKKIITMKKTIFILMTIALLVAMCFICIVMADSTQDFQLTMQIDNPVMTVNGIEQEIDPGQGTAPVVINERTLVPVRAIIETMGGIVGWTQETQTVTLNYGNDEIQLIIGNRTAYLNGASNNLDTAPTIINERTMLPIRFIAESFKFKIDWAQETQTVTITKTAQTTAPTAAPSQYSNGGKTLVVYYSATNTTEGIAKLIADYTNADIFELEPKEPYTDADLDWTDESSRVNYEHDNPDTRHVELMSVDVENFDSYDTVFIGYPIWWQEAAWVVDDFVKENDFTEKTVIPFCTSASSPLGQSGTKLAAMAGTGNWFEGKRFRSSSSETEVQSWIDELNIKQKK